MSSKIGPRAVVVFANDNLVLFPLADFEALIDAFAKARDGSGRPVTTHRGIYGEQQALCWYDVVQVARWTDDAIARFREVNGDDDEDDGDSWKRR